MIVNAKRMVYLPATVGGQATGQVLLNGYKQEDDGENGEGIGGDQILPLDGGAAVEDVDTNEIF